MPALSTQPDNPAVAEALVREVEAAAERLLARDPSDVAERPAPNKWSDIEIVGHLIDSAVNNHQRFVRVQTSDAVAFPGYEQDEWVERQEYRGALWTDIVGLWRLYNVHLARVIAAIPDDTLERRITVGTSEPMTVSFAVEDYLAHLRHHLQQLGAV